MDDSQRICSDLAPLLQGEIFCDEVHRIIYSSAACMYEIRPQAVVYPKDTNDVSRVLEYCYSHSVPVTPRGAGSGLSGQAIGSGVVIDLSRHMNRILAVDREKSTARVQPGVVLAQLNQAVKSDGLFFPPDPSSGDYCTVGGMIANNSSGSRSLMYGATKDYIQSLQVVLSDGEVASFRKLAVDSEELKSIRHRDDHLGAIYTSMIGLLWRNREVIDEWSPRVEKNTSGYNLKEAFGNGSVDLTRVIAGSEGTLCVVTEATVALADLPDHRSCLVLFFDDLYKAGRAVLEARELEPSAIEFVNEGFLDAAVGAEREVDELVPAGSKAMLLVEFDGEEMSELEGKAAALAERVVRELRLSTHSESATREDQIERLWRVRKAAVPIIMKNRELKKPIPFVEDMVVPPERLPEFLQRLYEIFRENGVDAPAYGHAGEGNIHVRPLLDLTCQEDLRKMEVIAEAVYGLTKEVGGSPSGEHGDGLVRAPFLKDFSGPLYEFFFWTKRIFDPKGIMNPGKKVSDSPAMSHDLKFGPDFREMPTGTSLDERKFLREIEGCHGCGMCRSVVNTIMCPVYRATGDERYTPRSKANLLRAMISGRTEPEDLVADPEFGEIMGMCYGCRTCLTECPTQVNVPLLATVAKHEIVKKAGLRFRDKVFCDFEAVGRMGSSLAPLANVSMRLAPVRAAMERLTGLSRNRKMPAFNRGRFHPRRKSELLHGGSLVAYFPGCFVNFMDASLGHNLASVLEDADIEMVVPDVGCCGIPSISHGDLEGAKRRALENIAGLMRLVERGVPVVATCPSCLLALKREYTELFGGEDAEAVAGAVHDATGFVLDLVREKRLPLGALENFPRAFYHTACHQMSLAPQADRLKELRTRLMLDLVEAEDGCCGIGGTFGFKAKNRMVSDGVGGPLFESIRNSGARVVITECPTCKIQISQGTGLRVFHPVELLRDAVDAGKVTDSV
jgi:FAD/FMN-containing dehydrogenase/Fe-S oxidoreductase